MGSILATRLHCRGAAGIVTDGAYRDSPVIAELGMAAYAAAMNAHTNKTIHHPSEIQVPIACGDVAVYPGDIIVGDEEGVVVVPAHLAEQTAQTAAEMEEKEVFITEKIQAGASIVGVYHQMKRHSLNMRSGKGKGATGIKASLWLGKILSTAPSLRRLACDRVSYANAQQSQITPAFHGYRRLHLLSIH